MDQDNLELVIRLTLVVISALLPPFINFIIRKRKSDLQFTYYSSDDLDSTFLVIRNIGSNTVFIDNCWLQKTYRIEYNLMPFFSRGIKGPIPINPGKTIRVAISEIELDHILKDAITKGKVNECWPHNEFRLAFKIVIGTSEGNKNTKWFKIGKQHGQGKCKLYDFSTYRKSYYDFTNYISSPSWIKPMFVPIFILTIGCIGYSVSLDWYLPLLLLGYISFAVLILFFVSDGLPNKYYVNGFALFLSILILSIFWTTSLNPVMSFLILFISFTYHNNMISISSGWNM